ncbi:MAG: hypothetical protein EPO13_06295 [Actinomycetota bacterium]|nr:MAG: hypothetical protein EPO13_06295 [Actinomycetota bacterium]
MSVTPPGWPPALPAPGHAQLPARAVAWLLDQGPPELRGYAVLRAHPVALARVVAHHVEACLDGARQTYAGVRRELGELLPPEAVAAVLVAVEAEGTRLVALQREVDLVERALRGQTWRPRLGPG